MKNTVLIIALLLSFSCPAYPDDNKFCNDPPHWEHFNSMVANDPDNIPLQILHALKIGLCVKINQNSISTQEAIGLFTDMLDTVIKKQARQKSRAGKKRCDAEKHPWRIIREEVGVNVEEDVQQI